MTFGTVGVNHLSVTTASLNNRLWLKPVSRVVLLPCAKLARLALLWLDLISDLSSAELIALPKQNPYQSFTINQHFKRFIIY